MTAEAEIIGLLDGQVALVAGGGGGIGSEAARHLAAAGASVAVAGRAGPTGVIAAVVSSIIAAGGEAMAVDLDVRSLESAHRAVATVLDRFGRLDVIFNAAGTVSQASLIDCTDQDFDDILEVHLGGQANLVAAAIETMRGQRGGRLIAVSSGAAIDGIGELAAYSTAKYAILGLTRHLARRLADDGITVNAISPTAFTSMSREGPPGEDSPIPGPFRRREVADVAPLICILSSRRAERVTGRLFFVSGGHVIEFGGPRPLKHIQILADATPEVVGLNMDWVFARPSAGSIGTRPTRDFVFEGLDGLPPADGGLSETGDVPARHVAIEGATADMYRQLGETFGSIGLACVVDPAAGEPGVPLVGAIVFPASISGSADDIEDVSACWLRVREAMRSTFAGARALARVAATQRRGVLVLVLPPHAEHASNLASETFAAGLLGLAKSAWRSLEPMGVSVHAVYGPALPADAKLFASFCAALIDRRTPWPTGGLFSVDQGHIVSLTHETPLWQHFGEARLTSAWTEAILRAMRTGGIPAESAFPVS